MDEIKNMKNDEKVKMAENQDQKIETNNNLDCKELIDLGGAPTLSSNKNYYTCIKCSSYIEILSINELDIEFKCRNNHKLKMRIFDYLSQIKSKNKNINLEEQVCNKHNLKNYCYCFECDIHLCKECIKTKEHSFHYKVYLNEITPENEILINLQERMKQNEIKIKNLKEKDIKKEEKINNMLKNNINKKKKKQNQKI